MGRDSGGGGGGSGRSGRQSLATRTQKVRDKYGARAISGEGEFRLGKSEVEDAIDLKVRYRRSGSVDTASIGGQTISANSVSSVRNSAATVRYTAASNSLNVLTVGGQAYVQSSFRAGIDKIAGDLGATVTWRNQ